MTEAQRSMLRTLMADKYYVSHRMVGDVIEVLMIRHSSYGHNPYGLDGWSNEHGQGGYRIPPNAVNLAEK